MSIGQKLEAICRRVYHADGVRLSANAGKQAERLEALGFGGLPICMAKTQYSFSDDPALLGAPDGFTVNVRELKVNAGAGFVVADWEHHDHARPAEGAGGGEDRRRRKRRYFGIVLKF